MTRLSLLFILLVTSSIAAMPVVAEDSDATWEIGLLAANNDTVVGPDGLYCRMPATMPLRPGNTALLQDSENQAIDTATFLDAVADRAELESFQPDDPCHLAAKFQPIAPQDGLRVVITAQPHPAERSTSSPVRIDLVVLAFGPFDWSYDEFGYKTCRPRGDVQIGDSSPVVTTPVSQLYVGPNPQKTRFVSSVTFSEAKEEEYCLLVASLEFPIADEYVIEFGGESQAESGD